MAAEVAGAVVEKDLMEALFSGHARLTDRVGDHMSESLRSIGAGASVEDAVHELESTDALLVQEDGKPVGVVTRQDLLGFVSQA